MSGISVAVVVPVYNSETTLKMVLDSLDRQSYPVSEVILIDNNSRDSSFEIISSYKKRSRFPVSTIRHEVDRGLSYSYNEAIKQAKSSHIITLQSDCVIGDSNGVDKLVKPFSKDKGVVATCSLQVTPWSVWSEYNFWQKCLFSRHIGKTLSGRNGRFCCFSVEALKRVGLFNEKVYRTAGEDADIFFKLGKIGKILDIETVVEHVHSRSQNFRLKNYVYKENQLAEAVGACLSINFRGINPAHFLTALARPVLVIGLVIPKVTIFFALLVVAYSILFTGQVFIKEWKNPRIFILPFVNLFLLYSYTYYFFKGFVIRRQEL